MLFMNKKKLIKKRETDIINVENCKEKKINLEEIQNYNFKNKKKTKNVNRTLCDR